MNASELRPLLVALQDPNNPAKRGRGGHIEEIGLWYEAYEGTNGTPFLMVLNKWGEVFEIYSGSITSSQFNQERFTNACAAVLACDPDLRTVLTKLAELKREENK